MPGGHSVTTKTDANHVPAAPDADQRLLNLLKRSARLDAAQVAAIEQRMAAQHMPAIDAIVASGVLSEGDVAEAIARELKVPRLDLHEVSLGGAEVELIEEAVAHRLCVVPVSVQNGVLVVAMANPLDREAIQTLEFSTGLAIRAAVAPRKEIRDAIARLYTRESSLGSLLSGVDPTSKVEVLRAADRDDAGPIDVRDVARQAEQPPIVKIVNLILFEAFNAGASDIHIEPGPHIVLVRYRIDGVLEENLQVPKWVQAPIVARVKVLSKLDITERRLPQDGHFALRVGDATVDVRVSSMPTMYGEKLVLRLLDPSRGVRRLADIGLSARDLATLRRLIERPEGMILVTGPTGSGKTTTLYAIIQEIVSPEINIVTIENPIEYELKGVTQIPINEKQGLTFAETLRSVLRQDPDVIFVGEIRDHETALVAFQAAQTGHLVLSTVHTNDTAATVTRLLELGIDPHTIGPSLLAVVAQRLARKVCVSCAEPVPPAEQARELLGLPAGHPLRRGRGCSVCRKTGFSGRTGCYEVLEVTKGIEQLIEQKAPENAIRTLAEEQGMTSVLDDARTKVLGGLTTPSEVLRVIDLDSARKLLCPACHSAVEETYTVCPSCRNQLHLICSGCGTILKKGWTACAFCGTPAATVGTPHAQPLGAPARADDHRGTVKIPRVLVVGDDQEALESVRRALAKTEKPIEIEVAESGEEALAKIAASRPHLIVLDLSMPGLGGYEICRRVRADLKTALIPIIMLAGAADAEAARLGFLAGTDDFIGKPFEAKEFLARVGRLLARTYDWSSRHPKEIASAADAFAA
jgi:type II secretory ATPase GspE/PulE/Tfp pilus assembly ATPase PilB-like protein/FixJ family two-component response regulator